jgi:hypothetical protein
MATDKITVTGIAKWAQVFEQNRDTEGYMGNARETNGQLSIEIHFDQDNYNKLLSVRSGKASRRFTPDPETGLHKVKFTRPWEGKYDWASGPIPVTDVKGNHLNYDAGDTIYNGAKVMAELSVYDSKAPVRGTRIDSVMVLKNGERVESATPEAKTNKVIVEDDIVKVIGADGEVIEEFSIA